MQRLQKEREREREKDLLEGYRLVRRVKVAFHVQNRIVALDPAHAACCWAHFVLHIYMPYALMPVAYILMHITA